jgi:Tc5 transposase DNA-binding domain
MAQAAKEAQLQLALAECRIRNNFKFATIAREFGVDRTILRRRFDGTQTPRTAIDYEFNQKLSKIEEETLIGHINRLTERYMPPTSQIVHNIAEEISKRKLGKNWVSGFVKRHSDRLHSAFLRTIDNLRISHGQSYDLIEEFFAQVCIIFRLLINK